MQDRGRRLPLPGIPSRNRRALRVAGLACSRSDCCSPPGADTIVAVERVVVVTTLGAGVWTAHEACAGLPGVRS